MQENKMTIIDDDGVEREVEIILTFDGTDNNHYVLFRDPQDPEGSVYPYQYECRNRSGSTGNVRRSSGCFYG